MTDGLSLETGIVMHVELHGASIYIEDGGLSGS